MSYLLKNAGPYTLTLPWHVGGDITDVGDVTIGIVDANGDEVVAAATATTNTSGTYTYSLESQTAVGLLTATWTDVGGTATRVSTHEVIGSELFTESDVRTFRTSGQQTPFASATDYPDAMIARWHMVVADMIEQRTKRGWIRRYARCEMPGSGNNRISLRAGRRRTATGTLVRPGRLHDVATVLSVTVDGETVATSNVVIDGVTLHRVDTTWARPTIARPLNVVIEYEYGADPTPWEARENALRLFAANAAPNDVSAYATSWNNEDGTFRISTWPVKVEEWLRANTWSMTAVG